VARKSGLANHDPCLSSLGLEAFLRAADEGPLVWVHETAGQLAVCSGPVPSAPVQPAVGNFFVIALREHFGEAASDVAERELGLSTRRARALPARTIFRAAACAESAQIMLQAQTAVLRIEFSAELLGRRFTLLCRELSIDPMTMSLERRQFIDQGMLGGLLGAGNPTPDEARGLLQLLISQALH
jgi:hypothetical protein